MVHCHLIVNRSSPTASNVHNAIKFALFIVTGDWATTLLTLNTIKNLKAFFNMQTEIQKLNLLMLAHHENMLYISETEFWWIKFKKQYR